MQHYRLENWRPIPGGDLAEWGKWMELSTDAAPQLTGL